MPTPRVHLRTLMLVVAVVALDCALVPLAERLAGALVLGVMIQLGLFRLVHVPGWARRFWGGFTAAGVVMLVLFAACRLVGPPVFIRWPRNSLNMINSA